MSRNNSKNAISRNSSNVRSKDETVSSNSHQNDYITKYIKAREELTNACLKFDFRMIMNLGKEDEAYYIFQNFGIMILTVFGEI